MALKSVDVFKLFKSCDAPQMIIGFALSMFLIKNKAKFFRGTRTENI